MFRGSIPPEMRSILHETVRGWPTKDIWVGCAGNFTVERALADLGLTFHSNDVTIYSSAIGYYLSGKEMPLALNPEYLADYGWLEPYFNTPENALATMLLCSELVMGLGKHNIYYDRIREAYRLQWPAMHSKTVEKVKAVKLRLASYDNEDITTWIDKVPEESGFVV